jgi:hypothetical protein
VERLLSPVVPVLLCCDATSILREKFASACVSSSANLNFFSIGVDELRRQLTGGCTGFSAGGQLEFRYDGCVFVNFRCLWHAEMAVDIGLAGDGDTVLA